MKSKTLHDNVFSSTPEEEVFNDLLGCFDNMTLAIVPRAEYEALGEDILKEIEDGYYHFFLPENLNYIELLRVIDVLNKEFQIEDYAKFDEILLATKIGIGKTLEQPGGEQQVANYIIQSGVSRELQDRISNISLLGNYTKSKEIVRMYGDNGKIEQQVIKIYRTEFEKTFLRRGVSNLRRGLMIFTQNDAMHLYGKEGKIVERTYGGNLDNEEKRLRDVLEIDTWKQRLLDVRKDGDIFRIGEEELNIARRIFRELQKYPYQANDRNIGAPADILDNKELHCVGFSMIAHSLFTELGIQHSALSNNVHIALLLHIGSKSYFFDATGITFDADNEFQDTGKFKVKPVEQDLLDSLNQNLRSISVYERDNLFERGEYESSIQISNKILIRDPENANSYLNIGNSILGVSTGDECIRIVKMYMLTFDVLTGKGLLANGIISYRELNKLLEEKDFPGVRDYLYSEQKKLDLS